MSPPVGPTGLAQRCHGAQDAEAGPRLRVSGTVAAFRTTLVFDTDLVPLEQLAASAGLEWRASPRWTLVGAAGGVFTGQLGGERTGAGGVVSLAGSFLALEQGRFWPFVQLAASLAFSGLDASGAPYVAVDGRLAVVVGYTFLERVTPYLVGRAFGGPVFYASRVGTDRYHYQVGAGLVVGLPAGFDVSAEVCPFGEQRLSGGVGFSW